jgi:hypothetical protein
VLHHLIHFPEAVTADLAAGFEAEQLIKNLTHGPTLHVLAFMERTATFRGYRYDAPFDALDDRIHFENVGGRHFRQGAANSLLSFVAFG